MPVENAEERIAELERQVDALTLAVQSMTHAARPQVFGASQIDQSWLDHLTEKYGEEGATDVIRRLIQMGVDFGIRRAR